MVRSRDQNGQWNAIDAVTSLTGLSPSTSYSIQVAAVNEEGDVGIYSNPVTIQTSNLILKKVIDITSLLHNNYYPTLSVFQC